MPFEIVLNPISGRYIRKGSVLHMSLIKRGLMNSDGPIEPEPQQQDKKIENDTFIKTKDSNKCIVKYRIKKM